MSLRRPETLSVTCLGLALVLILAGCATQRPVLYPNSKLKRVGNEVAQQDIDDCIRLAEQYGVSPGRGEKVVRGGGGGAAVGAGDFDRPGSFGAQK